VVKVIWHRAAIPPHTYGSIVFTRLGQCASSSSTPKSASAPYQCCPLLSRFGYINHWTCRGLAPFCPENCLFTCGDLDHCVIYGSLGPPESTSQMASWLFLHGWQSRQADRQTDRPHYSIYNNRPHLASAAMWPKKLFSTYIKTHIPKWCSTWTTNVAGNNNNHRHIQQHFPKTDTHLCNGLFSRTT